MGVSIGRLREDSIFDWKFVGLAHNTLRGAAGGALECAEMLKRSVISARSDGSLPLRLKLRLESHQTAG